MDGDPVEQVINELFPYFEALETRSAAILQFLKDTGLTTDEQFAPYLEQASNGSNVKWLAARVRVERLLSSAFKEEKDKDTGKPEEAKTEPTAGKKVAETSAEQSTEKSMAKTTAKSTDPATAQVTESKDNSGQNAIDGNSEVNPDHPTEENHVTAGEKSVES